MNISGASVHSTAIIDPKSILRNNVRVGPYVIIGPGVKIGRETVLGPHVVIEKDTTIGDNCDISASAVLGGDPQDLKYSGEKSHLHIGSGTTIREFATVNRGTADSGETRIGEGCLIMAYVHIAHDCVVGNDVVISNAVNMGGHVQIQDGATIGGLTAIHQFVRIGRYSFSGGGSRITQDVPPYVKVAGNPVRLYGLNTVGLTRRGIPKSVIVELRKSYQELFQSKMNISQAIQKLENCANLVEEVEEFIDFIRSSDRGIVT